MSGKALEHVTEWIPGYALGALDPAEAGQVEAHLAACPECRRELVEHEAVVDLMALALAQATPSPELKTRLVERTRPVASAPSPAQPAPVAGPSWGQQVATPVRDFFAGPAWRPAVAVLVLILIVSNVFLLRQVTVNNRSPFDDPNSPWRRPVRLAGSEDFTESAGIIYVSGDGKNGTLVVNRLPALTSDEAYQLWLIKDGERTSGAVFSVNEEGYRGIEVTAPIPLSDYEAFGITIEPAGGSPQPTGQRVLGYNLD